MPILYDQDFSGLTVGVQPPASTKRWETTNADFTVETVAGFTGDAALRLAVGANGNANRILSFDDADATQNAELLMRRLRLTTVGGNDFQTYLVVRGGGGVADSVGYAAQVVLGSQSPPNGSLTLFRLDGAAPHPDFVVGSSDLSPVLGQGDELDIRLLAVDIGADTLVQVFAKRVGQAWPAVPTVEFLDSTPLAAGWVGVGTRPQSVQMDIDRLRISSFTLPPLQNLAASTAGPLTARIEWDDIPAAGVYRVRRSTSAFDPFDGEGSQVFSGAATPDAGKRFIEDVVPVEGTYHYWGEADVV